VKQSPAGGGVTSGHSRKALQRQSLSGPIAEWLSAPAPGSEAMSGMIQRTLGRLLGTVAPKHYDCLVSLFGKYLVKKSTGRPKGLELKVVPL
jgi:hypothetical protein